MIAEKSRKRSFDVIDEDDCETSSNGMRSGKWSPEEEIFANRLVFEFERGALLDCEDGCTLRSYLARKLNCAPMRISKKFAGRCIGKMAFVKRHISQDVQEATMMQLQELHAKSCRSVVIESKRTSTGSSSNGKCSSDSNSDQTSKLEESSSDDDVSGGGSSSDLSEGRPVVSADDLTIENFNGFDYHLGVDISMYIPDIFVDPQEWQEVLSYFSEDTGYTIDDSESYSSWRPMSTRNTSCSDFDLF